MTTSFKAVLFDFGGVFTDSPFDAFTGYAAKIGASEEQVLEIVFGGYGVDGDHPWHRVERGEMTLEDTREAILELGRQQHLEVDIWEVFMAMSENGGGLREELVEYVSKIRAAGYSTAIITNNVLELKEHWRSMLAVDELFDFVIDSSEVGLRKPNPAIYQKALDKGGWAASEVIFLDDFAGNIESSQNIGIQSILVDGDGAKTIADLDSLLKLNV